MNKKVFLFGFALLSLGVRHAQGALTQDSKITQLEMDTVIIKMLERKGEKYEKLFKEQLAKGKVVLSEPIAAYSTLSKALRREGYAPFLKMLLEKELLDPNAQWHNEADGRKCTMLMEAIDARAVQNARLLLQSGANPNTRSQTYYSAQIMTPVYAAVLTQSIPMIYALFEHGADANKESKSKPSLPLSLAIARFYHPVNLVCQEENTENALGVVKVLLENGARLNAGDGLQAGDVYGRYPKVNSPLELANFYKGALPKKYASLHALFSEHFKTQTQEGKK